ncbi:MAG TPA: HAMP domain-containing sensor histidine kinase [Thermoleophilia bacterium]|nr:HAMP domain-containing sensor histidine kinase [Thermoleophilia bacterium]
MAGQEKIVVAVMGAGAQGVATLKALLAAPDVEVRYVVDPDLRAPGVALAREHGIRCETHAGVVTADAAVDLILETGGDRVRADLEPGEHPDGRLMSPAGTRLVASLVAEIAAVEEDARVETARYLRQASHQVKSPLTAIQSSVNVILGGYTGEIPERTRETVQKIHARIDAALAALAKRRLLADLRCVDRDALGSGTASVTEALQEAVARHAETAAARGVELRVPTGIEPDRVRCVPEHLVALFSELVENAVVYSRDGGVVEVSADVRPDGRLAVAVRDHGIGVPERCLPKIFDEDYRADVAVKHYADGAGLGLAVAREIAGLHGFDLEVRSDEGSGSVFTAIMSLA